MVRPARPRSTWRSPWSTRRSATSSPSAPTPTGSPCSTTSPGVTRGASRRSASSSPRSTAAARRPTLYRAPFVSGKDSLNNEYVGHDGQRHAVPPTLVITAVAHVPDADRCVTPDLHDVGNVLFQVGATRDEFAGSHLDMVDGQPDAPGRAPAPDPDAPARYRRLHAADPRRARARRATTSAKAGWPSHSPRCASAGASAPRSMRSRTTTPVTALFSESIGRFVVEVAPADVERFVEVHGRRRPRDRRGRRRRRRSVSVPTAVGCGRRRGARRRLHRAPTYGRRSR